jgi:hypothetical protein
MSIQPVFFNLFYLNYMLIKIATLQASASRKWRDLCLNQFLCLKHACFLCDHLFFWLQKW